MICTCTQNGTCNMIFLYRKDKSIVHHNVCPFCFYILQCVKRELSNDSPRFA